MDNAEAWPRPKHPRVRASPQTELFRLRQLCKVFAGISVHPPTCLIEVTLLLRDTDIPIALPVFPRGRNAPAASIPNSGAMTKNYLTVISISASMNIQPSSSGSALRFRSNWRLLLRLRRYEEIRERGDSYIPAYSLDRRQGLASLFHSAKLLKNWN